MTLMEFFGCGFIAYGAPVTLFILTIASDPLKVIVLTASAFFWLCSLLLSSILWFAVVPLRKELAFGLVFSVIFQELARFAFYILLKKADQGLHRVSEHGRGSGINLINNPHLLAYVSGLGFGLMAGAFSLVNVLADMTGPGTLGLLGGSYHFFITSAFLTLCFIFLHTFWSIIFFNACDKRRYWQILLVVTSHMLVSAGTLLNQMTPPLYAASLGMAYVVLLAFMIWSFFVAGGSLKTLKDFFSVRNRRARYSLD